MADVLLGASMTVQKLSDKQLGSMISNYRARGVSEGGRWSLSELLLEERRRKPTAFPPRDVASTIIRLSQESPDGLVSYHDIWRAFLPEREWKGNAPRKILADALYRVIGYCVEHRLPILTVLVVRKSERRLSPEAVEHIYNESREMGVDVGPSPVAFVESERAKALRLRIDQMPSADTQQQRTRIRGDRPALERSCHRPSFYRCKLELNRITLCLHRGAPLRSAKTLSQKNFGTPRAPMHPTSMRNPG